MDSIRPNKRETRDSRQETLLSAEPPEPVVEYVPIIPDGQLDQLGSVADRLAAAESAAQAAAAIRDAVAARATPPLAPAVEAAQDSSTDEAVDWDRLLDLPAVAAKIAQAQAGLADGAGGYGVTVLGGRAQRVSLDKRR